MQNIPYVRTAADLERKYNLSALPTIEKNTKTNQEQILKTNTMLEEFTAETIKNLENLQDQVDGNVTTYYYSGVPTLLNLPVSDWKEEEYNVHLGDLYYDKDTGYAYRFYLDTEPNVYGWVRITDSDITEALAIANTAQDTADAKRRVFVVEPKPPYDVGDIWFKEDKDLFRCKLGRQTGDSFNNSDWILATNYTDDTAANEAKAELSDYKVYVETTYETQADFIKEKEALELKVSKVETVANDKNKVFTSEPKTPYLPGDVYIKETTVEGMKQNLIYVCQTGRESGDYNPNDFSLQPSYASQSDLKLTDNKIAGVVQSVETLEKEVTTIKETSGNNSLYIEDALESRVLEYGIDGKSEQETRSGKNLLYLDNVSGEKNGITYTWNGTELRLNGTATASTDIYNFGWWGATTQNEKRLLKAGTYTLSTQGNNHIGKFSIQMYYGTSGTIGNHWTNLSTTRTLTEDKYYSNCYISIISGATFNNEKFYFQLESGSTATNYEQYGASPSPDFPSEIKNLTGVRNLYEGSQDFSGTWGNSNSWTKTDETYNGLVVMKRSTAWIGLYKDIQVEAGKTYTFSVYAKSDTNRPGALYTSGTNTAVCNPSYTNKFNLTNEWQRFTLTFKVTTSGIVRARFEAATTLTDSYVYVCGYQLEEGSVAHSYVPYGSWLKVQTTGKNIFDSNLLNNRINGGITITCNEDGTLNFRGKSTVEWFSTAIDLKLPLGTYSFNTTIEDKTTKPKFRMWLRDTDGIHKSIGDGDIFTTTREIIRVSLVFENMTIGQTYDLSNVGIQLEKGTKTDYEPYKENISLIDMNKPNLFDKDKHINAYINGSQLTQLNDGYTYYIEVEPNTQYTFKRDTLGTNNRNLMALSDKFPEVGDTITPLTSALTTNDYTFTTTDNTKYVLLFINRYTTDTLGENTRLYKGENSIPYHELCSIGNIKDNLILNPNGTISIEKKIDKFVLDGSESWVYESDYPRFYLENAIPNAVKDLKRINTLSSHFQYMPSGHNNGGCFIYNASLFLYNTSCTSITGLKTWLSENKPIIQYELAEPYTIDLGTIDISLFENINHINLLEDIETDTRVKYLINNVMNGTYATKGELELTNEQFQTTITNEFNSLERQMTSITQTGGAIDLAIQSSKDYTDSKNESLDNRITNSENNYNDLNNKYNTLNGKITDMNFSFKTDGLTIGTSGSEINSKLDNKGLKIYNANTLIAIFNQNGSGFKKLIATESIQLQNLLIQKRVINTPKANNMEVISFFFNKSLIENLTDLESD